MHLWPPPPSGVVIQNGGGCDYSVLAPLCPRCRTCALHVRSANVITGTTAARPGRRVSALPSSLISSAAYLNERLSGVRDCLRACVCLSSHLRKLRLHCCNFHQSAIGLSWREDAFSSSWLARCLAVFCLFEIVFSLKWGPDVEYHTLRRKCAQTTTASVVSLVLVLLNCYFFF